MPHRGSGVGHIRRIIKSLVRRYAQFDGEGWEAISTLDRGDLVCLLSKRFRDIPLAAVPGVMRGGVLYDSRGLGSMQRRREDAGGGQKGIINSGRPPQNTEEADEKRDDLRI
jgi:hypothetical protein